MKRDLTYRHDGTDAGSERFHAVVKSAREDGEEAARESIEKRGFVRTRRIVRRVCDAYTAGRRTPYLYGWGDGALNALVDHAYRHERRDLMFACLAPWPGGSLVRTSWHPTIEAAVDHAVNMLGVVSIEEIGVGVVWEKLPS